VSEVDESVSTLRAIVELDQEQRRVAGLRDAAIRELDGLLASGAPQRKSHRDIDAARERAAALQAATATANERRRALLQDLSSPLRKRYESLVRLGRWPAAVALEDGYCGGCHLRVQPRAEIQLSEVGGTRACPHCQRLLLPGRSSEVRDA